MGFPIYNFTHPADQSKLQSNLSKKGNHSPCPSPGQSLRSSSPPQVPASSSSSNSHTLAVPSTYHSNIEERGPRQSFYIRLREKPLAKHDKPQYEHMHVVGHLRRTENVDEKNNSVGQNTFIGVMRPVRDRWAKVEKGEQKNLMLSDVLPFCRLKQDQWTVGMATFD